MKKPVYLFVVSLLALLFVAPYGSIAQHKTEKLHDFHQRLLTLDSHTDTPLRLGRKGFDIGQKNDPHQGGGKIDFPRMKQGGLDAVFFAVFVGQGARDSLGNSKAKARALSIFDHIYHALDQYPEMASLALSSKDAVRINKTGKRAVYIGIENGYPLGTDLSMVETYYDKGARYITLCHTKNNDICDSSTDDNGPEFDGLSPFGEQVVREMNRLGMMVDVSHISDSAFFDVLKTTERPVIASHSNARAVCNHPRNMTDEMLLALKENGGVVQLCVLSSYVKEQPEMPGRDSAFKALRAKYNNFQNLSEQQMQQAHEDWAATEQAFPAPLATVADLVDHLDHIVNLIGIEHVGIGTDFDGGGALSDCFDVSEIENITRELVRRGYSKRDIRKIWSGNFLRVFSAVEQGATKSNS
jgi:membrane dipeptidase